MGGAVVFDSMTYEAHNGFIEGLQSEALRDVH